MPPTSKRRTTRTNTGLSTAEGNERGEVRSGRYTPPGRRIYRLRPGWHKALGAALVVAGAVLFFVCQLNIFGIHEYGGHVWYVVGFAIAGYGSWWFGWYDRAA